MIRLPVQKCKEDVVSPTASLLEVNFQVISFTSFNAGKSVPSACVNDSAVSLWAGSTLMLHRSAEMDFGLQP